MVNVTIPSDASDTVDGGKGTLQIYFAGSGDPRYQCIDVDILVGGSAGPRGAAEGLAVATLIASLAAMLLGVE